ncbi:MAG: DUF3667 domain-containing protein [Bacteroidetes bacterium]|nr:DUF3667 domain-containing protein [Bacteroidota bacterium]
MDGRTSDTNCTNCGSLLSGRFCPECGQKRFTPDQLSLARFLSDLLREFSSLDGRIFRTIGPLLLKPGTLTLAYLSGEQRKYIRPVSLFLLFNLFFFLAGYRMGLLNWSITYANGSEGLRMLEQRAAERGIDPAVFVSNMETIFKEYQRSMFFGVIPAFAVVLYSLLFFRRRYFVEHLIYSIHYHAAYLLLLPVVLFGALKVLGVIDAVTGWRSVNLIGRDPGIVVFVVVLMAAYHVIALRKVYHFGWIAASALSILVSLLSAFLMVPVAREALFWIVWYTS